MQMRELINLIQKPNCFKPGDVVCCIRGDNSNTLLQVGKHYTVAVTIHPGCGCYDKNGEILKDGLILVEVNHPYVWDADRFSSVN